MAKVDVICRYCHKTEEVKEHGKGRTGHPRYHCYACRKTFQLTYTYQACNPGMKVQIIVEIDEHGRLSVTRKISAGSGMLGNRI